MDLAAYAGHLDVVKCIYKEWGKWTKWTKKNARMVVTSVYFGGLLIKALSNRCRQKEHACMDAVVGLQSEVSAWLVDCSYEE